MIKIPYTELKFEFSRSSGAGGQNVNKVNSKVTLYWDIDQSNCCSEEVKKRFKNKYRRFVSDNKVIITSQKHRGQHQNIKDCIEKLESYLNAVRQAPKARKATLPTRASIKKRLDKKSKKSKIKKMRGEKF